MKTKRLVILLSIFALIIMIVVLSSTVFSLSKVQVSFVEVPTNYSIADEQAIIDSGKFDYGTSIFLVNKSSHIDKIEAQFPNLMVVNIETIFPNKLMIQVVERQEFLALYNSGQSTYYVVDGDMKVLRVVDNASAVSNVAKCMVTQDLQNYEHGDFVALDNETTLLSQLCSAFWQCEYSEKELNSLVRSVYFDSVNNELIISTYCRFWFTIKNPYTRLPEKLYAGNDAVFGAQGVGEDFVGEILVYENAQNNSIDVNAILNGSN